MIVENINSIQITYPEDCGNAPKKNIILNLYKAYAKGDNKFYVDNLANNATCNIIGKTIISGKDNIILKINNFKNVIEIIIKNIITHGKIGASHGLIKLSNNTQLAFCDIFVFSSSSKKAKIKEITSYIIKQ